MHKTDGFDWLYFCTAFSKRRSLNDWLPPAAGWLTLAGNMLQTSVDYHVFLSRASCLCYLQIVNRVFKIRSHAGDIDTDLRISPYVLCALTIKAVTFGGLYLTVYGISQSALVRIGRRVKFDTLDSYELLSNVFWSICVPGLRLMAARGNANNDYFCIFLCFPLAHLLSVGKWQNMVITTSGVFLRGPHLHLVNFAKFPQISGLQPRKNGGFKYKGKQRKKEKKNAMFKYSYNHRWNRQTRTPKYYRSTHKNIILIKNKKNREKKIVTQI